MLSLAKIFPLIAVFCFLTSAHAAEPKAQDPLFEKMKGTWLGKGERRQLGSGRITQVEIETRAEDEGDRLVSRNVVRETTEGRVKSYVREYWIKPAPKGSQDLYVLGIGTGESEQIVSQGRFEGGILEVQQIIAADPPFVIRSRTEFGPGRTVFFEKTWHGENPLSESRIEFTLSGNQE